MFSALKAYIAPSQPEQTPTEEKRREVLGKIDLALEAKRDAAVRHVEAMEKVTAEAAKAAQASNRTAVAGHVARKRVLNKEYRQMLADIQKLETTRASVAGAENHLETMRLISEATPLMATATAEAENHDHVIGDFAGESAEFERMLERQNADFDMEAEQDDDMREVNKLMNAAKLDSMPRVATTTEATRTPQAGHYTQYLAKSKMNK